MLTLFLLAAAASAQEPACTERIAPQRLTQEIEALRQGLLNGEEAVGERLNALFRNMNECVDGPVERSDIGKLLMARGAFGILTKKVAPEAAQQQMTWAYAISGRDVFDEAYGLEVQEAFDIATEGVLPRATIDLSFDRDPRVVVIDGKVVYDRGQRSVAATYHLIQWLDKNGWHSETVVLTPGEEVLVGSETSSRERRAEQDRRQREEEQSVSRAEIRERRGRNARKPRSLPERLEGPRLHLAFQGNYGLMLARFVHQEGASVGGLTLPSAGVSLEWDAIKGLGFAVNAHADAALLDSSYPSLQTRGAAAIRVGARGDAKGLSVQLGGAWRLSSSATGGGPESGAAFEQQSIFGGEVAVRYGLSNLTIHLSGGVFPREFALRSSALYRLPELPVWNLQPRLGLTVEGVLSETGERLDNTAYGSQLQLQLLRSF